MPPRDDPLNQTHPHYDAMAGKWARYAAFTGDMESHADKKPWLAKGSQEAEEDYKTRLALTHCLGFSRSAVRRVVGAVTKTPANRDYEALESRYAEKVLAFDHDVDRTGTGIDAYGKTVLFEALKYGLVGTDVTKDGDGEAPSEEAEGEAAIPFVGLWLAPEIINWDTDAHGRLLWVVLKREITEQGDPSEKRKRYATWRVLGRENGADYRQEVREDVAGKETDAPVELVGSWAHGLGVVPFAVHYGFRAGPLRGVSYIDELSLADWRKLQMDSDQAMASYLHGSPQLVVKTTSQLEDVGIGTSHVLKLNPQDGEDAAYLSTDANGMTIREQLIESTIRQGFNLAGIDPSAVTQQEGGQARSGVSLAWSFSTAEEPQLNTITSSHEAWDRSLHEIVMRYMVPARAFTPSERVFDGRITRVRSWDIMGADRAVDLTGAAWEHVKSPTWRRAAAKDIAQKVPGCLDSETLDAIGDELDAADYEAHEINMAGFGAPDDESNNDR